MYQYNTINKAYQTAFENMDSDGVDVLKSAAYKRYLELCKNEKREYKYAKKRTKKENT